MDNFLDSANPIHGFATDRWHESPPHVVSNPTEEPDQLYQRLANVNAYLQHGSHVAWHRYTILGYYVYHDCTEFDKHWNRYTSKQTFCAKMVWYNFMYHVDRHLDIHPKLQAWETDVARPHLAQTDPSFLCIDTTKSTWQQILDSPNTPHEEDDGSWTQVGSSKLSSKKKSHGTLCKSALKANPKHPRPVQQPGTSPTLTPLPALRSSTKKGTPVSSTPSKLGPPVSFPLNKSTPSAWGPNRYAPATTTSDIDSVMSDAKQSAYSTNLNSATKDGTHRLTFRWKPTNYTQLTGNQVLWLTKLLEALQVIFTNQDGMLYRWESTNLTNFSPISELTSTALRDYISPKITSLDSISTFVFGLRFSFAHKNHVTWRSQAHLNKLLKDNGLGVSISNSTCDGGRLVIAGYILFKAPNTTHRVRYL